MKYTEELEVAISQLEARKQLQEDDLKEEVKNMIDSLRPSQLLKRGLSEMTGKDFLHHPIGTTVAAATGQLARKVLVRNSGNIFIRGLGNILKWVIQYNILKKAQKMAN